MILVMTMIPSLPNLVVSLMIHLLTALIHVVVVSLLMLLHFHVVVPLVLLRLHIVVPLVHLLMLLLHHLRALTELWWRLMEVVRMLQLVNRRRLLVLNMVAQLLVAGWWLLHLLLGPLLRLLLVVRMLSLVTTLVVERHSTSVPHARVAEDRVVSRYITVRKEFYLKLCMAGLRWPRGPPALPCCCTGTGAWPWG